MTDATPITDPDEIQRILEQRAAALARSDDDDQVGETLTLVVIALGGERYGVPIASVREISAVDRVTALPATPPFWIGMVNMRGTLHAVLDLRRYLAIPGGGDAATPQVMLVHGSGMTVGLRIDQVLEVRDVPVAEIGPPLVDAGSTRAEVCTGLTTDLVAVLDVDALLADRSLVVNGGFDIS